MDMRINKSEDGFRNLGDIQSDRALQAEIFAAVLEPKQIINIDGLTELD